jgi:hypothetical protein
MYKVLLAPDVTERDDFSVVGSIKIVQIALYFLGDWLQMIAR